MRDAKVCLVGHCGPDAFALRNAVGSAVPGATVEFVNDDVALESALDGAALLLINRILCGRFTSEGGLELMRQLAVRQGAPPMLLVSNYAEAQQKAEDAGALPGFGKKALYAPETRRCIRAALGLGG